jgi:hypothetical protein
MVESGPKTPGADLLELRYLRTVGQGERSRPVEIAWDVRGSPFDSRSDLQQDYWRAGSMDCWSDGVLEPQQAMTPKLHYPKYRIVAPPHSQEVRVERLGPFFIPSVNLQKSNSDIP